ncbi:MAG: glutaredoxin family protein [Candidatus Angelobacter sp.]
MKLTVYTAPWCRDCHVAKRWLAQNNISYHEINIEETPGAAEEVIQRTGKRAIPQFVVNGAWVQPYSPGEGFKYDEMAELFGVSSPRLYPRTKISQRAGRVHLPGVFVPSPFWRRAQGVRQRSEGGTRSRSTRSR